MKIGCYGDSTMFGSTLQPGGGYAQAPNNIPATLGALAGPSHTVVNRAIGGTTSTNWLEGTGPCPHTWDCELAHSDDDMVIINTGINDSFISGFTTANYTDTFTSFRNTALRHNKAIVFMTPNPINDPHNAQLWGYQHALNALGQALGVQVIDQYNTILSACPIWQPLLPDNLHPDDDTYRFMGNVLYLGLRAHL
jgi:lysophospholipase L1-like esterase